MEAITVEQTLESTPAWTTAPIQRVLLASVSWNTYQQLLAEHDGNRSTHFTYDEGLLEIMVLSARHERKADVLSQIVAVLAEELEIDIVSFGSTTFQRQDLQKGFEPDACFYIPNEPLMRDKLDIDLNTDPAPDLIIEVDITSPSLNKFPIFAALGIAEIWRYDGESVRIWSLKNGNYQESTSSQLLSVATGTVLTELLEAEPGMRRTEWLRRLRSWVREQISET